MPYGVYYFLLITLANYNFNSFFFVVFNMENNVNEKCTRNLGQNKKENNHHHPPPPPKNIDEAVNANTVVPQDAICPLLKWRGGLKFPFFSSKIE